MLQISAVENWYEGKIFGLEGFGEEPVIIRRPVSKHKINEYEDTVLKPNARDWAARGYGCRFLDI